MNYFNLYYPFIIRDDCFPFQTEKFGYMIKRLSSGEDVPIDENFLKQHIEGKITLGTYNLNKENKVKWGCLDYDENDEEDFNKAKKAYNKFKELGFYPLMENSGGGIYKTHIWIFCEEIDAEIMKNFLEYFCEKYDVKPHEIFPKQSVLLNYGNLVKLPLAINKKTNKRSYLFNDNFEKLSFEEGIEYLWKIKKSNIPLIIKEKPSEIVKPKTFINNPDKDIEIGERFINFIENNIISKDTDRNGVVLKNYVYFLKEKGFNDDDILNKGEKILNSWEDNKLKKSHINSWIQTYNQAPRKFNAGEIINWIKRFNINIELPKNSKFGFNILDIGVDRQAIEIINENPIYYDKFKQWFGFNEDKKQWKKIDEVDIIGFIKKTYEFSGLSYANSRQSLLNALKDEGRYRKPKKLNDYQIQIGKYIYDIRNDNVILASHEFLPNIIINQNIDEIGETDECPFIDKLFEDWCGKDKNVLYDIIAFCMSPKYFLDIAFWFVGKGNNGKGLFTTIINNVVGFDNTTSQDIEILSDPNDRFTKGFLKDKLVCLLGDGNPQLLTHTKGIKTLSGCTDRVRGEIKGGGQIDFFTRAKLIGAYNTLPETSDKSDGFYRRQHITEFKNNFDGLKNPIPNIPKIEYTILAKKCFLRLKEIYKTNEINGWGSLDERRDKYERLSNPIGLFIKDELVEDYDGYCFGRTLHKHYTAYAIRKGHNKFTLKDFEARLMNQGFQKKKKDIYSLDGYCWGKKKHIPNNIDESELDFSKLTVFCGFKFKKIEQIVQIEPNSKLKTTHEETNLKSGSICTKSTKNNNIPSIKDKIYAFIGEKQLDIDIIIKNFEHLGKENVDKTIKDMLNDGDIYEIKPGVVKLL